MRVLFQVGRVTGTLKAEMGMEEGDFVKIRGDMQVSTTGQEREMGDQTRRYM